MRFGVVVFPGSNCDHDAWYAVSHNLGQKAEFIWHDSSSLGQVDAVILPGGFSYGDYLRCGAIAKFSPVMDAVRKFASGGGLVLGICNGFQILVESGLLPGALLRNQGTKFVCRPVTVRVETTKTPFTGAAHPGQILRLPVAHGEGRCLPISDKLNDGRGWGSHRGAAVRRADLNGSVNGHRQRAAMRAARDEHVASAGARSR